NRFPFVVRHLRRYYADPMTGQRDWVLVRNLEGGIVGVRSRSELRPIKQALFPEGLAFGSAVSYGEWRFIAPPPITAASAPAATGAPGADRRGAVPQAPLQVPAAQTASAPALSSPPLAAPDEPQEKPPSPCERIAAFDQKVCAEQFTRRGAEMGRACL